MAVFTGKQYKNAMRDIREAKHLEAIHRNSHTPHERTKAHRLGKCEC